MLIPSPNSVYTNPLPKNKPLDPRGTEKTKREPGPSARIPASGSVLHHFFTLVMTALLANPVGELPLTALGTAHHPGNRQFEMGATLALPRFGRSSEGYRHKNHLPCRSEETRLNSSHVKISYAV